MEEKIIETIKSIEVTEQKKEPNAAEILGFEELDINELNEDENKNETNEDENNIKVNKIPGVGRFFKKEEENESNENKEDNQIE